jgi:hypothetical protein
MVVQSLGTRTIAPVAEVINGCVDEFYTIIDQLADRYLAADA